MSPGVWSDVVPPLDAVSRVNLLPEGAGGGGQLCGAETSNHASMMSLGPRAFPNTQMQTGEKPTSVDLSVVSVSGPERIFIGAGDKSKSPTKGVDEAKKKAGEGGPASPAPRAPGSGNLGREGKGREGGKQIGMGGETNPFPITREWTSLPPK